MVVARASKDSASDERPAARSILPYSSSVAATGAALDPTAAAVLWIQVRVGARTTAPGAAGAIGDGALSGCANRTNVAVVVTPPTILWVAVGVDALAIAQGGTTDAH